MKVIVVGCGRVGSVLAYRLYQKGHQVTVVDPVTEAFENLPPDFRGRTITGEALNQDVLRRAGIKKAEALAAVTNSDAINAVVARVAHAVYHVPRVVVRNYDPRWRPLHEQLGLPVVSSASWGAQRLEELLCSPAAGQPVLSAGHGEVCVYEVTIPAGWQGRRLADLCPPGPDGCLPVALVRAGQACLPTGETALEAGDVLYLSTTPAGLTTLGQRLGQPVED